MLFAAVDVLFAIEAFGIMLALKGVDFERLRQYYLWPLLLFVGLWVAFSLAMRKYSYDPGRGYRGAARQILICNGIVLLFISFVVFFTGMEYSRLALSGAVLIATVFELAATWVYLYEKNLTVASETLEAYENQPLVGLPPLESPQVQVSRPINDALYAAIVETFGEDVFGFLHRNVAGFSSSVVISTTELLNLKTMSCDDRSSIVNLHRINDIPRINKFFEEVNAKLPFGGVFVGCVETYWLRKKRVMRKFAPGFNYVMYGVDFLYKRVMPKLSLTKGLYFALTRGNNRVLSQAETYGRLYSCGFEVTDELITDTLLFFSARKVKQPVYDMHPSYGPLIKLQRHGRNGKMIGVYKMRTMHPYAEYLQEYVFQHGELAEGGKFRNDFRVTELGKLMRKLWLDELPMILNLLKGELKLVGVRPLSRHYFSLYDRDLQERRSRHKPGLVPPFYADMPRTLQEIQDSERRYLDAHEQHPWRTDWIYFWRAFANIVFRHARSG